MSLAASADSAAAPTPGANIPRISWVHPPGGFAGLSLLNGVLRILTLGVYHFWGKTEVRQRIWSAVRIDGEPLEYRGTGGELLRGFLIVFFLILLPMGLASFASSLFLPATAHAIYNLHFWGVLFLLSGIGIHRARRYRLSRTRWRGIRGGLSGRSRGFAWTYLWTALLVPLTLGWILPWRAVRLQKTLFDDTRFGDNAFTFTGVAGPLYKRFWLVWFSAFVLIVARLGGDFRPSSASTCRAPAATSPTMRKLSERQGRGRRRHRARRLADLRHDPRLVQRAHAELLRRPHQAAGGRLHARGRRHPPWCGSPPATISSASSRWASCRRSRRRARCATSSTGCPATAPSPGTRSLRTPTRC